jgi:hypothetical protein
LKRIARPPRHFRPAYASFFNFFGARMFACRQGFMDIVQHNIAVGKYLVSPLIHSQDDGRFAASVSIRSGRGSGMHDRVMRFTPRFASHAAAVRYAVDQGLGWVRERHPKRPAQTPSSVCFAS